MSTSELIRELSKTSSRIEALQHKLGTLDKLNKFKQGDTVSVNLVSMDNPLEQFSGYLDGSEIAQVILKSKDVWEQEIQGCRSTISKLAVDLASEFQIP